MIQSHGRSGFTDVPEIVTKILRFLLRKSKLKVSKFVTNH